MWTAIGQLVYITLITVYFSAELQGLYYTLFSIVAFQTIIELGMSTVLIQYAAHETDTNFRILNTNNGTNYQYNNLKTVFLFGKRYYFYGSLIFIFLLMVLGSWFLSQNLHGSEIDWLGPFTSYVIFSGLNLMYSPFYSIVEGVGFVKQITKIRLYRIVIANFLGWVGITCGLELYCLAMSSVGHLMVSQYMYHFKFRNLFRNIQMSNELENRDVFIKSIKKFKLRVALSWISGYVLSYSLTPLILHNYGAEEAGKFGMTMTVVTGLFSVPIIWMRVKIPMLSKMIANGKIYETQKVYRSARKKVTITSLIIIACSLIVYKILLNYSIIKSDRFVSFPEIIILCICQVLQNIVYCFASYLRCYKLERFVLTAVMLPFTVYLPIFYLPKKNVMEITCVYAVSVIIVTFALNLIIYYKTINKNNLIQHTRINNIQ